MQYLEIHPENPQPRLISQAVAVLRRGGVIIYPTDSCYALGCHLGNKDAMERIRRIRDLKENHDFTLMCRDLSELSTYARIGNREFRLIKSVTPGPYTFVLSATREVPRRLQNPKRKTIGVRIPDNPVTQALLDAMGEPIMSVTLILPNHDLPLMDPEEINQLLDKKVDMIINSGSCGHEPTTVVDLLSEVPRIIRKGKGDTALFT